MISRSTRTLFCTYSPIIENRWCHGHLCASLRQKVIINLFIWVWMRTLCETRRCKSHLHWQNCTVTAFSCFCIQLTVNVFNATRELYITLFRFSVLFRCILCDDEQWWCYSFWPSYFELIVWETRRLFSYRKVFVYLQSQRFIITVFNVRAECFTIQICEWEDKPYLTSSLIHMQKHCVQNEVNHRDKL